MKIIVTGGYGFIGSCLIKKLIQKSHEVLNIDIKSYASMPESLDIYKKNNKLKNIKINISDIAKINKIFKKFKPDAIFHLAAESHVDNSINSSKIFIDTNIIGTYSLLEATRNYIKNTKNLNLIPKNKFYNMPDLISEYLSKNLKVGAYKIKKYWIGIENIENLQTVEKKLIKKFK